MSANTLYYVSMLLAGSPFMAMAVILAHYLVRRAAAKRANRMNRRRVGFIPSATGLGMAFLFMQVFTRPSLSYVLEAKQQEQQDEDDSGDPESPAAKFKHFHRQLRRIRRGERIDGLVWRL
ncbi:MAG: hypothetical protein ABSF53_12005 [Terracidiphilus sp.]